MTFQSTHPHTRAIPDPNDRTPNDPAVLIESKHIRAFFHNATHRLSRATLPEQVAAYVNQAKEKGWVEALVIGNSVLLNSGTKLIRADDGSSRIHTPAYKSTVEAMDAYVDETGTKPFEIEVSSDDGVTRVKFDGVNYAVIANGSINIDGSTCVDAMWSGIQDASITSDEEPTSTAQANKIVKDTVVDYLNSRGMKIVTEIEDIMSDPSVSRRVVRIEPAEDDPDPIKTIKELMKAYRIRREDRGWLTFL